MGDILIGTSGFSYDDWKGVFYPPKLAKKDFIGFYAQHFRVLELNYSYYRMPEAKHSQQMIRKSGAELEFLVKGFREMTHDISERSLSEAAPRFLQGVSPFMEAGQLGGILLQFPQSFHYIPTNRLYLKSLIELLLPCPIFLEFRQKEWLKESVYKALRELGVGFVCVDEPALPSLLPPLTIWTSQFGYIRFHGRNSEKWYGTDAIERYDYLYNEMELKEWIPRIRTLQENTEKLFIFFNNHARAQAVTNTKMLINLIHESD
jgi:uncharacterized protein YecE (DUF72 family)